MNPVRIVLAAAALVVVAFVVGAAAWWFFVREDNQLATSAPAIPSDLVQATEPASEPDPATGDDPAVSAQAFVIIPDRSEAAYFADEQLASLPLPSTAKGTTNEIEGTFYLTEDGWDLDPNQTSSFTVMLANLTSDEDRRDNRVRDALNVAEFPTATFTATSVSGVDTSLPPEQEHTFQLTGILDLRGVQREVTWEVQAQRQGNVMTALATLNFLYADFEIPPPNIGGFVSVEDDVTLQVQVVAQAGGDL